jgi:hypothetical protein
MDTRISIQTPQPQSLFPDWFTHADNKNQIFQQLLFTHSWASIDANDVLVGVVINKCLAAQIGQVK